MPSLKLITDKNQFKKGIYNIAYKFSLGNFNIMLSIKLHA